VRSSRARCRLDASQRVGLPCTHRVLSAAWRGFERRFDTPSVRSELAVNSDSCSSQLFLRAIRGKASIKTCRAHSQNFKTLMAAATGRFVRTCFRNNATGIAECFRALRRRRARSVRGHVETTTPNAGRRAPGFPSGKWAWHAPHSDDQISAAPCRQSASRHPFASREPELGARSGSG
jgi:hypothetical protein